MPNTYTSCCQQKWGERRREKERLLYFASLREEEIRYSWRYTDLSSIPCRIDHENRIRFLYFHGLVKFLLEYIEGKFVEKIW